MSEESVFKTLEQTLFNLDQRHSNLLSNVENTEGAEEFLNLIQDLQSFRSDFSKLTKDCPVLLSDIEAMDIKLKDSFKDFTCQINDCFGKDPDYKLDLEQINDKSKMV